VIDVLATSIPFQLLRKLSGAHAADAKVPNREIVMDVPIQLYTSLLSAIVYGIALFGAYQTVLPRTFALYFNGLYSLTPAYSATFASLLPITLLFGVAARVFIFTPFAAAGKTDEDAKWAAFDPVSATLEETFWYNVWGYTSKTKVIISRTAVVMGLTGVNTYLQCAMTVSGVESYGAAIYAGVWVVAAMLTGLSFGLVGGD
jgi:hypothetical protein